MITVSPDLSEVDNNDKKTKQEGEFSSKPEDGGKSIFTKLKEYLGSKMPDDHKYDSIEEIDGKEVENLTLEKVEMGYKTSVPLMKDHLIKFSQNKDLEKKLVEVFEWWADSDLPDEKLESIINSIEEVNWRKRAALDGDDER